MEFKPGLQIFDPADGSENRFPYLMYVQWVSDECCANGHLVIMSRRKQRIQVPSAQVHSSTNLLLWPTSKENADCLRVSISIISHKKLCQSCLDPGGIGYWLSQR